MEKTIAEAIRKGFKVEFSLVERVGYCAARVCLLAPDYNHTAIEVHHVAGLKGALDTLLNEHAQAQIKKWARREEAAPHD